MDRVMMLPLTVMMLLLVFLCRVGTILKMANMARSVRGFELV